MVETKSRAALPETLNPEQRLTCPQLCQLLGVGRTSVYAMVKAGRLPQPQRIGPRISRWRAGDVLAALAPPQEVAR
jgi:prophage regulatory protein